MPFVSATIAEVVTAIAVRIARTTKLTNNFAPYVRDLNDTPIALNQGECPQVFFLPALESDSRITFNASATPTDTSHHDRVGFTILAYYADEMEALDQIWASRPRTAAWCDAFIKALGQDDSLGIDNLYCEARSEVKDGLRYNEVPFRGSVITITGYYFS